LKAIANNWTEKLKKTAQAIQNAKHWRIPLKIQII
jgi:hypothetical protein